MADQSCAIDSYADGFSGEPFYLHSMAVCQIVLDYNQEEATLLGALLHDTVEDTPLTLEQVALLFN